MRRGAVLQAFKLSWEVQRYYLIEIELACCQKIISRHVRMHQSQKTKEQLFVVGRIRTCAGRPQWISSPSP